MFRTIFLIGFISLALGFQSKNGPPPVWKTALMARYIIHKTDWVSLATISTQSKISGYPFVTVKSMSDGLETNSTGVPYFYMTTMELSQQDIEKDNRCTILATLSEIGFCEKHNYDPQDPRCAKAILTGRLMKVDNASSEFSFAQNSLFEKHPQMRTWPLDHGFFVSKMEIEQVEVLDFFGGIAKVKVEDYFNANVNSTVKENFKFNNVDLIDVKIV